MKNLLIAGGGTGGHIAPAIALGRKAADIFSVSYACTPRPVDRAMYSSVKEPVHVMNPPRMDKGGKLLLPFTGLAALFRAMKLLKDKGIDAVLGTGGYSSFFSVTAAGLCGIPSALLETNAVSGRSNRLASRFCRVAFTGFKGGARGLHCPVKHTGTPVSEELAERGMEAARKELGIRENTPVVLFLGGSQGARAINDLALNMPGEVHVLLQCGKGDYERVSALAETRINITVKPFLDDLSTWYSAAELAVARAGGQTIAELSVFRVPAVLIPFPYAADDHQTANAAVAEGVGAAVLREQKGLTSKKLSELLLRLLSSKDEMRRMSDASGRLYPNDPGGAITGLLRELVE